MSQRTRRIVLGSVVFLVLLAACFVWFQLQTAFLNIGQEFGAYGQYHRVLHVIEEMDELETLESTVTRELEWDHLFHVEQFVVKAKSRDGKTAELLFKKNTPEMREKDRETLKRIILSKFEEGVAE